MDFLDRFTDRERERLLSVAQTVRLARGEALLRRGEPGGDLYRVEEGELEVFDARSQPVIVLQVLGKGLMVGEMAFLDESPRSADVRAAEGATCQRWERRVLMKLLHEEPSLGARFFEMVARMLSERVRDLGVLAQSSRREKGASKGSEQASAMGRTVGDALRKCFMQAEPLARKDRPLARSQALTALHNLQEALVEGRLRLSEVDQGEFGAVIAQELHPYLIRSRLGQLAIERSSGRTGDPETVNHVLANKPVGDGPVGEFIDEWLLSLPTSRALRERRAFAIQSVLEGLPPDAPLRILVLNALASPLLGDLLPYMARLRGEITCVDTSDDALRTIDTQLASRPSDLRLKLVHDDLGKVCLGQASSRFPPQDIVMVDGLMDYVPERLCASLLGWSNKQLAPAGRLVATGLADAEDDMVYRHLLQWPLVRRTRAGLTGLLQGAGFVDVRVWSALSAGLVATARAAVPGVG